jgi:hypothetical protein
MRFLGKFAQLTNDVLLIGLITSICDRRVGKGLKDKDTISSVTCLSILLIIVQRDMSVASVNTVDKRR